MIHPAKPDDQRIHAGQVGRAEDGTRLAIGWVGPLVAGPHPAAKGLQRPASNGPCDSGAVEAGGQANGENARMGGHHQGNQHFGLGEGRNHDRIGIRQRAHSFALAPV
jgi:hypothetical protein